MTNQSSLEVEWELDYTGAVVSRLSDAAVAARHATSIRA